MSTRRNQDRTSTNYSSLEKRQVLTTIGFDAGTGVLTFTGDATDDVVMDLEALAAEQEMNELAVS